LPVSGGFLYVETIYIQATEARMPQLKKVVLAIGDRLIYRDTFEQALAELTSGPAPMPTTVTTSTPKPAAPAAGQPDASALAERLTHLREQAEQLTKDLQKLENDTRKK
jgi:hypothetical protein